MKPFQQTIPLRLHIAISFHYQANKASNFRINEYQTKGKCDEWTIKPLRDTQIWDMKDFNMKGGISGKGNYMIMSD
jgi:hypothetical protein